MKFADQSMPSDSKFIPQFLHEFEEREILIEALKEAKLDAFGFGLKSDECDISAALRHGDELEDLLSQVETRNVTSASCLIFKGKLVGDKQTVMFKNLQFIDKTQEKINKIARMKSQQKLS